MLSKIAGMVQGEITRAASMFQAAQARFLSLLRSYEEQVSEQEGGPTPGGEAPDQDMVDAGSDEEAPISAVIAKGDEAGAEGTEADTEGNDGEE
jgi:hypothetical protein